MFGDMRGFLQLGHWSWYGLLICINCLVVTEISASSSISLGVYTKTITFPTLRISSPVTPRSWILTASSARALLMLLQKAQELRHWTFCLWAAVLPIELCTALSAASILSDNLRIFSCLESGLGWRLFFQLDQVILLYSQGCGSCWTVLVHSIKIAGLKGYWMIMAFRHRDSWRQSTRTTFAVWRHFWPNPGGNTTIDLTCSRLTSGCQNCSPSVSITSLSKSRHRWDNIGEIPGAKLSLNS